jgi:glycosyltransferase involved in cell wall biosynthesis
MAATRAVKAVCINGRFLTQAITGVQRYATEIVRALDQRLAAEPALRNRYSFSLVTPRNGARSLPLQQIPIVPAGRLRGQAWEQLELPLHARHRILLNLCNTAPVSVAGVVTIHDASVFAFPQAYSLPFRLWYRTLIPLLGRLSKLVLTVSAFSRGELNSRAGIPQEKVRVVHLGSEHVLQTPADARIFDRVPVQPGRYILAVGSRSPHKNLSGVLSAVALLGDDALPLVAAGGSNQKVFTSAARWPEGSFHPAGYVTDAELRALYENASCFVYPSLYEGFGLPPLEAMSCGCPTVVSQAASLPEVCGNAVLYCDPLNPEDIARQIRRFLREPGLRAEYRDRGIARARSFTWDRASAALLTFLEDIDRS